MTTVAQITYSRLPRSIAQQTNKSEVQAIDAYQADGHQRVTDIVVHYTCGHKVHWSYSFMLRSWTSYNTLRLVP